MNADPNLPAEGDYPTDEIDVWPMLAEDFVVDDNGALHGKSDGRFVKKARLTILRTIGEGKDAREMPVRLFTWADVAKVKLGPEHNDGSEGPNVFEWPDEPGVEWDTNSTAGGAVVISKPVGQVSEFRVTPKPRGYIEPEADVLRGWAKRNGFTVKAKGPIAQKVWAAHRAAWEAEHKG